MNRTTRWLLIVLLGSGGCMETTQWSRPFDSPVDEGDAGADAGGSDAGVDAVTPDDPSSDTGPTGDDEPESRPVDPVDGGAEGDDDIVVVEDPVASGGRCECDDDCASTGGHEPLCIHGICGVQSTDDACPAGSSASCPPGHRCWSGTGRGVCYPDFVEGSCDGVRDGDGSCVTDGSFECYDGCGLLCELPGMPPDRDDDGGDEGGEGDGGDDEGDGLGPCTGTEAECLAARVINEYRAGHVHEGECNHPLRWNAHLGELAHEHQSGPFVAHSSYGYIENVGQAYGVRETALYIVEYEPFSEPHCAADGSYVMSHHCAAMYCGNDTVGVGVFQQGDATYMTMIFGDADGNPSW